MIYGGGVVAGSSPIAPVPNLRSRNLSRGTSSSDYSEGSFNSDSYYEYWEKEEEEERKEVLEKQIYFFIQKGSEAKS